MAPELAFEWANTLALLGWALLVAGVTLKPGKSRHWLLLAGGRLVPLLLCAAYVLLLAQHWGSAPGGNFGSLAGVTMLFASPGKLVGGWLHFLAFDLWLGRWMVDDVLTQQRSRWLLLPCLPLTFLFGPAGLLLYFGLKARPDMLRI
ncbi:MAG: ABA4-like family protein [Pseudomonadota bacterium]